MEYQDDERYAQHRAGYLARQTELRKVEAKAVAYAERGYSSGGAADKMGTSKSTVQTYHEKAIALYGFEILENVVTDDDTELPEPSRVPPDYFTTREDGDDWVEIVLNQEGSIPSEFVEDVRDIAKEHEVYP